MAAVVPLLLAQPDNERDRDHHLHYVWFGFLGPGADRFARRFGVTPLGSYGSTGIGFPLVNRTCHPDLADITGWLRPGYQARVVDQSGLEVDHGAVDELWIRPPASHLMTLGYLDRPELTEQACADGLYRTGDAVTCDASGGFRFVDRITDTIRRFGENISATALEQAVREDPTVVDCAAIGVASSVAGQEVFIAVIPARSEPDYEMALWSRLRERLPRYMLPRWILTVDDLPRSPNGKVRKRELGAASDHTGAWSAPG